MSDKPKPVHVEALKYHTFGTPAKEYNEGDTYTVQGDQTQTAEQYAETMTYLGMVKVVDPSARKSKDASADEQKKAKADSADEEKDDARPRASQQDAKVMKYEAAEKTVEHRKPANDVKTVKK